MSSTYEEVKPYIHGLFLAEKFWRENRDSHGYQLLKGEDDASCESLPKEELFEDEEEALEVAGALGDDLLSAPCSCQTLILYKVQTRTHRRPLPWYLVPSPI
jgi:hypothetical protein